MAEAIMGRVHNGVVVFEGEAAPLAEGTRVRVEPMIAPAETLQESDPVAGTRRWLLDWARRAEAVAPPLPSDLAREHDHYAHGKPRS